MKYLMGLNHWKWGFDIIVGSDAIFFLTSCDLMKISSSWGFNLSLEFSHDLIISRGHLFQIFAVVPIQI